MTSRDYVLNGFWNFIGGAFSFSRDFLRRRDQRDFLEGSSSFWYCINNGFSLPRDLRRLLDYMAIWLNE